MKNVFLALRKYAQQKKIGNDIPDKLLNSERKHRKRQGDVTSVHSERIFAWIRPLFTALEKMCLSDLEVEHGISDM